MDSLSFLLNAHHLYYAFQRQFADTAKRLNMDKDITFIIDDFFEICMHHSGTSVNFVDIGEQQLLLNPLGKVRQMVSPQLQDVYFDEIAEYVIECDYFTHEEIEEEMMAQRISSLCVALIDDFLREIMLALIQYPQGKLYFDSQVNATVHTDMTDLIIHRLNRYDLHVFLGFE